jgi:hypothetical protein
VEVTYIAEVQSFGWWVVMIPVMAALLFGVMLFSQVILHKRIGNRNAPNWLLLLIFILTTSFAVAFNLQKLKTTITNRAIYISFGVLTSNRVILLTDIKSIAIRKYDGMKEFSGWGVKGNDQEQSYTVSGDEGIEIALKSGGKKILIGTQKADKMRAVIAKYLAGN